MFRYRTEEETRTSLISLNMAMKNRTRVNRDIGLKELTASKNVVKLSNRRMTNLVSNVIMSLSCLERRRETKVIRATVGPSIGAHRVGGKNSRQIQNLSTEESSSVSKNPVLSICRLLGITAPDPLSPSCILTEPQFYSYKQCSVSNHISLLPLKPGRWCA